jgi:GxxExxY protein
MSVLWPKNWDYGACGHDPMFHSRYKGECLGRYVADIVVENEVIVELKCVDRFSNEHLAQCINYLKASHLSLALLINFQKPKVEWKRIIMDPIRVNPCPSVAK